MGPHLSVNSLQRSDECLLWLGLGFLAAGERHQELWPKEPPQGLAVRKLGQHK